MQFCWTCPCIHHVSISRNIAHWLIPWRHGSIIFKHCTVNGECHAPAWASFSKVKKRLTWMTQQLSLESSSIRWLLTLHMVHQWSLTSYSSFSSNMERNIALMITNCFPGILWGTKGVTWVWYLWIWGLQRIAHHITMQDHHMVST